MKHHGHAHNERVLARGFLLVAAFALVEAAGGYLSNSLTLIADAGHMVLDASALALSWWALRLSRREHKRLSYGYHRYQILAAIFNALALLVLVGWILFEAFSRLGNPEPLLPIPALAVAVTGLVVNLYVYRLLHGSENLNVRSAALHVLGDILGSASAIAAAGIVLIFDWHYADPILAIVVAAILVRGAWRVLRESIHILLEGVPANLDPDGIRQALVAKVADLLDVHHIHIWALTDEKFLLTLHATIDESADEQVATHRIKKVLARDFGIDHSTIQIERGVCPDV